MSTEHELTTFESGFANRLLAMLIEQAERTQAPRTAAWIMIFRDNLVGDSNCKRLVKRAAEGARADLIASLGPTFVGVLARYHPTDLWVDQCQRLAELVLKVGDRRGVSACALGFEPPVEEAKIEAEIERLQARLARAEEKEASARLFAESHLAARVKAERERDAVARKLAEVLVHAEHRRHFLCSYALGWRRSRRFRHDRRQLRGAHDHGDDHQRGETAWERRNKIAAAVASLRARLG